MHAIQLHGNEDDLYLENLKQSLPKHVEVWKTLHVTDHLPKPPETKVDALLLENGNSHLAGGSGQTFNWELLDKVDLTYGNYAAEQIILAGGINPNNIIQAVNTKVQRFDLASGVEASPGKKDIQKIQKLFRHLRR